MVTSSSLPSDACKSVRGHHGQLYCPKASMITTGKKKKTYVKCVEDDLTTVSSALAIQSC